MILEARAVLARYPGASRPALDRVDLTVAAGELVAVVGPNGGGKTTLVRVLLGLLPVEEGSIAIAGRPLAGWTPAALAQTVGVVPQREDTPFSWRVDELVLMGRYARLGALSPVSREDRDAVDRALARCDVAELRRRRVETLSGGEWQRTRIARALAQEPRALVLDEPTASLDVGHEMELFELVRTLVEEGLAGLVITHHLNLAARYADRMLLLDRGQVVAAGSPTEVLQADRLTRVFHWPVAVSRLPEGAPQVIPLRPRPEGG